MNSTPCTWYPYSLAASCAGSANGRVGLPSNAEANARMADDAAASEARSYARWAASSAECSRVAR
jgi:hypothetical protein